MRDATAEREQATRWALWLLAVAWLALSVLGGAMLCLMAVVTGSDLFGDPPDARNLRTASWLMVTAAAAWACGPLGIWVATRKKGWLVAAGTVFVLACAVAIAYLVESLDARGSL